MASVCHTQGLLRRRCSHSPSSLRPPGGVGEEKGDLPSPTTQLSQRRDSPELSAP